MQGSPFRIVVLSLFVSSVALSAAPLNKNSKGLAIEGYDPVAYFTESRPAEGDAAVQHEWNGAVWRFAGAENRDRFAESPESHAPQYGGYCAYAMSQGKLAKIDPAAWTVVDGKLFLNYSLGVRKKWQKNRAEYIRQADANWKEHLDAEE